MNSSLLVESVIRAGREAEVRVQKGVKKINKDLLFLVGAPERVMASL